MKSDFAVKTAKILLQFWHNLLLAMCCRANNYSVSQFSHHLNGYNEGMYLIGVLKRII